MLDPGLHGKKALITGGGVGIGRAIALGLADQGVDIAIANRSVYPDTIQDLRSRGVNVISIEVDVSHEENVIRMVEQASEQLGGLDLYVNNVAAHWDQPCTKITSESWNHTLSTNLTACVFGVREVATRFIAQNHGNFLIIGSTARFTLNPGELAYRVSKSALLEMMEGLAAELAPHGIRVNMVTPGLFVTRMTENLDFQGDAMSQVLADIPLHRPGEAYEELVPTAVLLLSDKLSSYTTGANFIVDGGIQLRVCAWRKDDELREMNL